MSCYCQPKVIYTPPACNKRCIRVKHIRIGCDDGPSCLQQVTVNLSEYVEGPTGSSLTYQLVKYESEGFSSVQISPDGTLVFTTTDNFEANKEFVIVFKVSEDSGILSDTGYLYVCMKDECKGKVLEDCQTCDPCNGTVVTDCPNVELPDSEQPDGSVNISIT